MSKTKTTQEGRRNTSKRRSRNARLPRPRGKHLTAAVTTFEMGIGIPAGLNKEEEAKLLTAATNIARKAVREANRTIKREAKAYGTALLKKARSQSEDK